ncbi:MAG: hypothetical protein A2283_20260 [Lentisphaerae bacterium RIFOXYA12_FULL_48_11]|nr:MAG: hypothetical protein A2283_20260 [Lentisphaerae bacterium RIFOXYA12_FULL_48_11]
MSKLFKTTFAVLAIAATVNAANAPEPRSVEELNAVLAKAAKSAPADSLKEINIVLVADKKDHGLNEHDYPLWQERWGRLLEGNQAGKSETQVNLYGKAPADNDDKAPTGLPKINVLQAQQWPTEEQWKSANLVVVFCYISWNDQKFRDLETYLSCGGGFVMIHSATWTKPSPSSRLAALTGVGGFTQWRHGQLDLKINTNHPICLGLPERIVLTDEPYWPPSPPINPGSIQILATSNEKLSKDSDSTTPQPMFWIREQGKGRVFGCVPGHYTWTFDDPFFRILLLRGMAWVAGESPYRFDSLVLQGARVKR